MTVTEMIQNLQELENEGYGDTKVEIGMGDNMGGWVQTGDLSVCIYDQKKLIVIEEMDERLKTEDYENGNEGDITNDV